MNKINYFAFNSIEIRARSRGAIHARHENENVFDDVTDGGVSRQTITIALFCTSEYYPVRVGKDGRWINLARQKKGQVENRSSIIIFVFYPPIFSQMSHALTGHLVPPAVPIRWLHSYIRLFYAKKFPSRFGTVPKVTSLLIAVGSHSSTHTYSVDAYIQISLLSFHVVLLLLTSSMSCFRVKWPALVLLFLFRVCFECKEWCREAVKKTGFSFRGKVLKQISTQTVTKSDKDK